ncbi:MAG: hypothetical protein J7M17_07990, partial [Anaerolineae bacterium]|nr:hypothetical protein [Anaerolineae bacterium]
ARGLYPRAGVMQASTLALTMKRTRQFVKRQASRARLPFIIHHSYICSSAALGYNLSQEATSLRC